MKRILVLVGAVALGGCVTSEGADLVEQGYERGTLGVAAIERQDWASAEAALTRASAVSEDDPARLINLGRVYMETGRQDEALALWRRALASDRHFVAATRSGQPLSTQQIARRALALYEQRYASR